MYTPMNYSGKAQYDAICSLFNDNEPVQWPNITNEPISEFHTLALATYAFPTLFPFGTGDSICSNCCCPV